MMGKHKSRRTIRMCQEDKKESETVSGEVSFAFSMDLSGTGTGR